MPRWSLLWSEGSWLGMTAGCLPPLKDCTVSSGSIRTSTQVVLRGIAMGSLPCSGVYWTGLANRQSAMSWGLLDRSGHYSGLFLPSIGVLSSVFEESIVSPGKKTAR